MRNVFFRGIVAKGIPLVAAKEVFYIGTYMRSVIVGMLAELRSVIYRKTYEV